MLKLPIVILGGQGMLGQDLAKVFSDVTPLVWDRTELDITNALMVEQKLAAVSAGTVINAAAYNAVDNAESDEGYALAEKVNAIGPQNLAQTCARIGAILVHYSTDYVFEGTTLNGYREDDQPNPQSRYGLSKFHGEQNVLATEAEAYIIRTCKLFGQPGGGEGAKQSFVDLMLNLVERQDELEVVDAELASPTYTPDLAKQTRILLAGNYSPGIYHITNSGACTWYEFAQAIFQQSKKKVLVRPVTADKFPRPARRPQYSCLLNTKLPPLRSWREALKEYLQTRA